MVSGSPKETVRAETAVLVFAPELGTGGGVVSGPLLKIDGVVIGTVVLVSSPGLVAKEAIISGTSEVVMIIAVVRVLAVLPDVLRRGSIPKVGTETLAVKVTVEAVFRAVAMVSALSDTPVDTPPTLAEVDARGTWIAVCPCAASLGSFVMRCTMSLVLANCVGCGGT